jgi:hypothetical protein
MEGYQLVERSSSSVIPVSNAPPSQSPLALTPNLSTGQPKVVTNSNSRKQRRTSKNYRRRDALTAREAPVLKSESTLTLKITLYFSKKHLSFLSNAQNFGRQTCLSKTWLIFIRLCLYVEVSLCLQRVQITARARLFYHLCFNYYHVAFRPLVFIFRFDHFKCAFVLYHWKKWEVDTWCIQNLAELDIFV